MMLSVLKKWWCLLSPLLVVAGGAQSQAAPLRWTAYFAQAENPLLWQGFDVVLLDLDQHPDLTPIRASGAKVLAYISIAEIAPYRDYYTAFSKELYFFLGKQERWGSEKIDIRNIKWQEFVIRNLVPRVKEQGFDGIFVDTLDTALELERQDPVRYADSANHAKQLLVALREALPRPSLLMVNRGFEVLPEIADVVDMVLAESILVPRSGVVTSESNEVYETIAKHLQQLQKRNRHLRIFTLDYPDLNDKTMIEQVFCTQRAHGFSPAVADVALQSVHDMGDVDAESCQFR
jgi:polysaccharide biosynthesis protein PelA